MVVIESPDELDRLLRARVAHADYLAARGRATRIRAFDAAAATRDGELREVGTLSRHATGLESFWLGFAIRDPAPLQGLYSVAIDGLQEHALLLVPSGRRDGVTEYHATFNREAD